MRVLKFVVNDQIISKSPDCDFDNIVAGTRGYLTAAFDFSKEWDGCRLTANFWRGGKSYPVPINNGVCTIPPEVLVGITFSVSVVGQCREYKITTNKTQVRQTVDR